MTTRSDSQSTLLSDFSEDCAICYSSESEGKGKVVKLACNHSYHLLCLNNYVESSPLNEPVCCVCRHIIFPEVLVLLHTLAGSSGMESGSVSLLEEEMVRLRSVVTDNTRRLDVLAGHQERERTEERANQVSVEELKTNIQICREQMNVMEQQMVGLRHQIRVLEDVLSVRVNRNTNPTVSIPERRVTRSSSAALRSVDQQAATSSISAPSSVRRTGARSVMMMKWRRFRTQRASFYGTTYPELSRSAIQEMIRNDWNRMSREEKQAIEL